MINESDLLPLREVSEVHYCERPSVSQDELAQMCADADYLMLNMDVLPKVGSVKLSDGFYSNPAVRALRTIAVDMTGVDYFSPNAAKAAGVPLQNIPHYSSRSVAESILAEILLHSRQRHLAYQDVAHGKPALARKGINLEGRRAGIVGYGSIGSTVASLLGAMGMRVVAWSRSAKAGVTQVELPELFASSDVVCVCAKTVHDGDGKSVGMVDDALLRRCNGAIVVNLANEALVDPVAMARALTNGHVAAYSVEASQEVRRLLESHPTVHFAASNAWDSDESMRVLRSVWVNNVISMIEGKPQNICA